MRLTIIMWKLTNLLKSTYPSSIIAWLECHHHHPGWPLSSQHQIPWLVPDLLFSQERRPHLKVGYKYLASASELKFFWAYPLLGYKIPSLSPNLGYICYCEGNLIVFEKCYSWHTKGKNTFSLTFPWPLSNSRTFPRFPGWWPPWPPPLLSPLCLVQYPQMSHLVRICIGDATHSVFQLSDLIWYGPLELFELLHFLF